MGSAGKVKKFINNFLQENWELNFAREQRQVLRKSKNKEKTRTAGLKKNENILIKIFKFKKIKTTKMTLCLRQRATMDKRHEKCRRLEFELAGVLGFRASVVTPLTEKRERVKTLKRELCGQLASASVVTPIHPIQTFVALRVPTYRWNEGQRNEMKGIYWTAFSVIFWDLSHFKTRHHPIAEASKRKFANDAKHKIGIEKFFVNNYFKIQYYSLLNSTKFIIPIF